MLSGQGVDGDKGPAEGHIIETMVPGLPVQRVNSNSAAAVGAIETMVPGLPGQNVNINGINSAAAVGPIDLWFQGIPGRKFTVIAQRRWAL